MRQDGMHFQLSALSNEEHVAKQPSVSVHDNLLGFSFGWFTLHCSEGLQLYFLNGIMETISLLQSLLFEFLVGMFSFLTRCQQVSGYIRRRNCPSGNAHEVGRIISKRVLSNCFPRDRPLKQRPTHLSLCGSFKDQCALWSHCPERRSPATAVSVRLHDVQLSDSNGTSHQVWDWSHGSLLPSAYLCWPFPKWSRLSQFWRMGVHFLAEQRIHHWESGRAILG